MDAQSASGILLIAAAVVLMATSAINAPGLYATRDIDARLEAIERHRRRWLVNQALVPLYAMLSVVGFALLASALQTTAPGWVPILGAAAMTGATISGVYFVYLQTKDPRGGYSGAYPAPETAAYWLWLAGTLLFGVALWFSDLPAWLGALTAGTALAYGVVFLVSGAGYLTPFLVALLGLVIGVVLLTT